MRTPCIVGLGTLSPDGYVRDGRVYLHRRALEHRLGRAMRHGEIARHMCVERSSQRIDGTTQGDRRCIAPEHLELGDARDNALDRERARRTGGAPEGRRYWR